MRAEIDAKCESCKMCTEKKTRQSCGSERGCGEGKEGVYKALPQLQSGHLHRIGVDRSSPHKEKDKEMLGCRLMIYHLIIHTICAHKKRWCVRACVRVCVGGGGGEGGGV